MEIKLSKEEFCLFSDESKILILDAHGRLIFVQKINENLEIRIYSLFEFMVEYIRHVEGDKTLSIKPVHVSEDYVCLLTGRV
ncbi:MAG: hypothetical protein MK078_12295 [Crocinitomicaceae bacterium]|nr:hypothetical protein [Crocinitomicaceae bacterium]